MKKLMIAIATALLFTQASFAKEVEHKVASKLVASKPRGYTRAKFTICNKSSMPLFFIGWAIDTWDSKPYRWNDWVLTNECRTDKFDKFFDISLFEFSSGPYEPLILDFVLREGKTVDITDSYIKKYAHKAQR